MVFNNRVYGENNIKKIRELCMRSPFWCNTLVHQRRGRICIFKKFFQEIQLHFFINVSVQLIDSRDLRLVHPRFRKVYKLGEQYLFCFVNGEARLHRQKLKHATSSL